MSFCWGLLTGFGDMLFAGLVDQFIHRPVEPRFIQRLAVGLAVQNTIRLVAEAF